MVGPPGVGKTMLARRLPTILPRSIDDEALEVTKIHSAAGPHRGPRAAHRSAVPRAAPQRIGGRAGRRRQPARAAGRDHTGTPRRAVPRRAARVPASVLESLRQPLEERVVRVSRASGTIAVPGRLRAGRVREPVPVRARRRRCRCGDVQRARYARRLSAPLLDRFDLRIQITRRRRRPGESSAEVAARGRGRGRAATSAAARNAVAAQRAHPGGRARALVSLRGDAHDGVDGVCERRGCSPAGARARIRRVARTIADLADRADDHAPRDIERAAWMREDLW